MKQIFNLSFLVLSLGLGLLVGLISGLFLTAVHQLIHLAWHVLPAHLGQPVWYPLVCASFGGLLVGLAQKYIGAYPRTMHETVDEFKTTKKVTYQHVLIKNLLIALVVLSFGASLGPEAALASILGGLITWLGERLKWTYYQREMWLKLSVSAMLAGVFSAPFTGVVEVFGKREQTFIQGIKKFLLYAFITLTGLLGFWLVQQVFPKEAVFKIRLAEIHWQSTGILAVFPAFIFGCLFGGFFLLCEKVTQRLAEKIAQPITLGVVAGIALGILGTTSPYFMFSGEAEIFSLSANSAELTVSFLLLLAVGKAVLTNLIFACGWRGGKIFPAIFSSSALAFALSHVLAFTPGVIVAVVVASATTFILKQPLIVMALLAFLLPLQLVPIIIVTCFAAEKSRQKLLEKLQSVRVL